MSPFVRLTEDRRRKLVAEGAARLGLLPVIVEKDYWVCWLLGRIFDNVDWAQHIVFKGGTSLSKVFRVIQRFSEDIDLSVSPKVLGFSEAALDSELSKTKRAQLFADLQNACAQFVAGRFQPQLEKTVRVALGVRAGGRPWLVYREDARTHSPVLLFEYPSSLPGERTYIEPVVKLEFGSLTDQQPTGSHVVKPMIATLIPSSRTKASGL